MPGAVYYHGYWINKNWFYKYADIFRKEFMFPEIEDVQNRMWLERIRNTQSVSEHIRRGDYVDLGWAVEAENYCRWLKEFAEKYGTQWEVFVFSDDIAWCRENKETLGMNLFSQVSFIEGNICGKNYIDMQLMSQCKAMIMSNSAFCYLAALLNTEMKVCLNPTSRGIW